MPPLPDPNAEAPTGPIKIKIDSIEPEAGPVYGNQNKTNVLGETRVLVRGGPFANMQLYYPKPMVNTFRFYQLTSVNSGMMI